MYNKHHNTYKLTQIMGETVHMWRLTDNFRTISETGDAEYKVNKHAVILIYRSPENEEKIKQFIKRLDQVKLNDQTIRGQFTQFLNSNEIPSQHS